MDAISGVISRLQVWIFGEASLISSTLITSINQVDSTTNDGAMHRYFFASQTQVILGAQFGSSIVLAEE